MKKQVLPIICVFLLLCAYAQSSVAQSGAPLRRTISPQQPMWLVHIDTWNYADPQKIIDLIPEDVRPYVVMNISLSISHNVETGQFQVAEYGYEIAKSWIRVCAENRMWAMIQPSSGGYCHFSDFDLSVYHEFFREYPNLIGFNYCEQFWGYDDSVDRLSPKWSDRITHFSNLLKLCNQYGGYLVVSWCGNQWSPSINPIAMLKRNAAFEEACRLYTKNYILCEKYTQQGYQSDMESLCLGAYLSGYSGQYGIRYDDTGWTIPGEDGSPKHEKFTLATAGAVHLEHIMLTGQTVIDGPELIWTQCFRETGRTTTADGFLRRNWETYKRFDNVMIELFRKILDGTVRIPTRKEVIDRTKIVVVNDVNTNEVNVTYSSPQTLFEGLYRMDGDGNYQNNNTFFKKTGRYPTLPTVYGLNDADANSFQVIINRSQYDSRWPDLSWKLNECNALFPEEYTGDIYAGRHENGWVTYNPHKPDDTGTVKKAKGSIPFQYNTCEHIELSYSEYTAGVMKEYADRLTFFLSNYDDELNTGLKTDSIRIYGSSSKPSWTYQDRGNHSASILTEKWEGGVFSLAVQHNGALDITVNCSGTATDRLDSYTAAALTPPIKPAIYTGPLQYEAECFDLKNVRSYVSAGQNADIRHYTGQGYVLFGTHSTASVRDSVRVLKEGIYKLETRYSSPSGAVSTIDLYVNGVKVSTPTFTQTASKNDWSVNAQYITLKTGYNSILLKANQACPYNDLAIDNFVIASGENPTQYDFSNDMATTEPSVPAAQYITVQTGSAGVVSYTNADGKIDKGFKTYSVGTKNATGVADLELFPPQALNYAVVWKEHCLTAGNRKGALLRATGENGACSYADGMKQGYLFIAQYNEDKTFTLQTYIANEDGLTDKPVYTTPFTVEAGQACWFRATACENQLVFECSEDSLNWVGGSATAFTDDTYRAGGSQLIWGLNYGNQDGLIDNILYISGNISLSRFAMTGFAYIQEDELSPSQTFSIQASDLTDNLQLIATDMYEIALNEASGYGSSLLITPVSGKIAATVHVRLKTGLEPDIYAGEITATSPGTAGATVKLTGSVSPKPAVRVYDFTNDIATTSAQTPPALNITVGKGNSATAGVVSFKDSNNQTSNMFKPYSSGQRNGTGVMDLNLFPEDATDYSVTWKQHIGTLSESKIGMLLRGDTERMGDATSGYVEGIMHGYLFIAYTVPSNRTEFRIYRSTSTFNSLNQLVNQSASDLQPVAGQPVWFRASVSGRSVVSLKFEYSTDGVSWKTGSSATDELAPTFQSGATQIVWGLAAGNLNFYLDDITFNGITESQSGNAIIHPSVDVYVLSEEYYTFMGQRVVNVKAHELKGFYIVRSLMSDGSIRSRKALF